MVEDRLVGIKSREVYEAPAAVILHTAHRGLESLTVDREVRAFKEIVSQKYANLVYDGLWFIPLKEALDSFIEKTQGNVTGNVTLKLHKGVCSLAGMDSPKSLYNYELATYGEKDKFDQSLA